MKNCYVKIVKFKTVYAGCQDNSERKIQAFQQMVLRKLGIHMQKRMSVGPYLTQCAKINSKWIKDLNVRPKTVKLLEENTGQKLHNTGFGNAFWDMMAKATKEKLTN